MSKTKEQIQKKWDIKLNDMIKSANYRFRKQFAVKSVKIQDSLNKEKEKMERKLMAYINKKTLEYKRKCANEIRKLEGKEERVYKKKSLNLLEFAMDIQQENSKLRDTDENGNGYCVSCGVHCSWENLHGGHDHSRRVKNICLSPININAQCKRCNQITWPLGNIELKERTQAYYRTTLVLRYWDEAVDELDRKKAEYFKQWYRCNGDYGQWDISLEKYIPQLIEKNKELWATKNFYKPKRNWEKVWNEHN